MTNLKFLALVFCIHSVLNDARLIEQTCQQTPNQNLCIRYLKSDPRSSDADTAGLALIMVDAIKAKAKAAMTRIHQLLIQRSHISPGEKEALRLCSQRYRAVLVADVPEAIAALEKGDPKFAEDGANDAALEANSCERSFSSGKSPLTHENSDVRDAAVVTAAIVRLLL